MVLTFNKLHLNILNYIRPVFSGLFLLCTICLCESFGFNYKPNISEIKIIGLSKTKHYIIKREIQHPINMPIDSSFAELDRNRIFNLGLFDEVSWNLVPLENGNAILQFSLIESINRIPPLIFPSYDEEKGWSLSGVLLIKNFQGKNRNIELSGSIGGQKKIQFMFSDPWIVGNHISLFMFIEKKSYQHLFLDRTVGISTLRMDLGKWYGEKLKFRFAPTISNRNFTNDIDTLSYNHFIPEIKLEYDSRDIYWNPKKGVRLINKFVPMIGENDFFVWDQSYSIYVPIFDSKHDITLALNTTLKKKWGHRKDVWLSYFGNSFNIRGWDIPELNKNNLLSDSYRFGHEYIFSSVEIRKLIIPKHHSRFGLLNGLSVVGFFDGGFIFHTWSKIKDEKLMSGAGIGIRIPIPLLESLRVDLGWGLRERKFSRSPVMHLMIQQKF